MKTGLVTSDTFQNHDTGPGHPEQIARVSVIVENFKKLNNKNLLWKKPSLIKDHIIEDTHDADYINLVKNSFPQKGLSSLDGDTIISPGSKEATFDAAGSIIAAIDGVENKEFKNAFCSVRPPGHHCNQNKAAGFCILNNIAIGAKYLLNNYKYKKIEHSSETYSDSSNFFEFRGLKYLVEELYSFSYKPFKVIVKRKFNIG